MMVSSLRVGEREEDHRGGRTVAGIIIAVVSRVVVILGAEIAVVVKLYVASNLRALDAQLVPCASDGTRWGTNCGGDESEGLS